MGPLSGILRLSDTVSEKMSLDVHQKSFFQSGLSALHTTLIYSQTCSPPGAGSFSCGLSSQMCSIFLRARSLYFFFFLEVVAVVGSARFGLFLVTTIDFYFS